MNSLRGNATRNCVGFAHSEICGSMYACYSPQLIVAGHVFHRSLAPRHPPCALNNLLLLNTRSFFRFDKTLRDIFRYRILSKRPFINLDVFSSDIIFKLSRFDFEAHHRGGKDYNTTFIFYVNKFFKYFFKKNQSPMNNAIHGALKNSTIFS